MKIGGATIGSAMAGVPRYKGLPYTQLSSRRPGPWARARVQVDLRLFACLHVARSR